jgi:hypothetical protein
MRQETKETAGPADAMTRYENLATSATRWVEQFYGHKDSCRIMVQRVATAFADYLGCPSGRISFAGLDASLRFTGKPALLSQQPQLVYGEDGCWHVGLQIMLQMPNSSAVMKERIRLGISYGDARYRVVLGSATFEIDETSLSGLQALLEAMLARSLAHYAKPVHAGPLPPGFMVSR